MNGSLYNNPNVSDKLWADTYKMYKVVFKDTTIKYTKARCKSDAEDNVRWFGDEDKYDDIISVEEMK